MQMGQCCGWNWGGNVPAAVFLACLTGQHRGGYSLLTTGKSRHLEGFAVILSDCMLWRK